MELATAIQEDVPAPTAQPVRMLTTRQVEQKTGYKKSWIYARIKEGKFPAPHPFSTKKNLWQESTIDGWIARRIAESLAA